MKFKKILVKSAGWEEEVIIDSDIFDDIFLEACTRVLENHIKVGNLLVSPFMETRLKRGKNIYIFNTYKILINASFHEYAENLRENFKRESNIDLSKEPIKG